MPIYVCVCIGRNPNFCSGNKHDIFVAYLLSFGQTNSTNKKYNMCISFQEESTFFFCSENCFRKTYPNLFHHSLDIYVV